MTIETLTLTHPSRFAGRTEDVALSFVVFDGPGKRTSFFLGADRPPRLYLGQSASCELRIADDPSISRRHAAIDLSGTHLTITDLDSRNGVFVNGVAVMKARLRGNEVIRIGDTKLRVVIEGVAAAAAGGQLGFSKDHFGRLWGASVEMRRTFALATRLSTLDLPILIEGESGTGKDLLAEAIHEASERSRGPFVVLDATSDNAASIATSLFGDGAAGARLGLIEQADEGTLLIDDISRLDLPTQARLLRLLDRSEIGRVGNAAVPADVRIIAATRRNLDREVETGMFREELLLRFAPGRIELPPLRRRDGDATLLIERIWKALGGSPEDTPYDLASSDHEWPGNVRELESAALRRLIAPSQQHALHKNNNRRAEPSDLVDAVLDRSLPLSVARDHVVQEFERRYLERALVRANGNVVRAASAAGVARRYFQILRARHLPKR